MSKYNKLSTAEDSVTVFGVGVEYAYTMAHHAPQSAVKPQIVPKRIDGLGDAIAKVKRYS